MDAVLMCRDWDPEPPKIQESDKVTFLTLNDISEQVAVWLCHPGGFFSSQTLGVLKFFAGARRCFSGRNVTRILQDGRFSTYNCGIFFLVYKNSYS